MLKNKKIIISIIIILYLQFENVIHENTHHINYRSTQKKT